MRIIFLGTPEFAVPSVDILHKAGYDIVGVITAPDRYGGRGRKTLIESDIKKWAISKDITILQPTNLKNKQFQEDLKALKADLQIVVAFRMLPEKVWNMPPLGTYNLHGSLLPRYRGAAPINWAIIKGEKETGVTSFKLKHAIDTGSLLLQRPITIYPSDTVGDLHDRMKWVAADVILETVRQIEEGDPTLSEQDETQVSHAPKLNKENTEIDFSMDGPAIVNFVRGLNPFPGAWFELEDKTSSNLVKVYNCTFEKQGHSKNTGKASTDNKSYLKISCRGGHILITDLKMTGKKRMSIKAFLNGKTLDL